MKNILQNKYVIIGITLIVGALIGRVTKTNDTVSDHQGEGHELTMTEQGEWTCSMHPQIRQNEPGSCPLCGMALIPVDNASGELDPAAISMSPAAMKLADVVTQIVGKGNSSKSIQLNGKVMENEQLLFTQSSHIPGRVESLSVDFTGEFVQKGQIIASIYSPDLVTAQQELFEANKIKEAQPTLFEAARKKLLNWKLTNAQIDKILANGTPIETMPIRAEKSGFVKQKMVNLGDYIKPGMPIYMLTDLSKVWVMFEAYETDMQWIKKGGIIDFNISSLPSESFTGKISFIDPVINPKTRVAKLRVEVNNATYQLKPEMFASGTLKANSTSSSDEIIIPKSAVMWTGQRSVVYVKTMSDTGTSFKMRMVTLGASLGESYVIKEGLIEGEEIVVNGTFSVDAAAQLAGKPSMMNPEGGAAMTGHNHEKVSPTDIIEINKMTSLYTSSMAFKDELRLVFTAYLPVKNGIIKSDIATTKNEVVKLLKAIDAVDMKNVGGDAHVEWMKDLTILKKTAELLSKETDIEKMRTWLSPLSDQLYHTLKKFRVNAVGYRLFCPMAFNNKGAYWLSDSDEILNPYFGDAMLTCGNVEEELK